MADPTDEEKAALRLQQAASSRLPGVGAPTSTPATDAANIQMGDALNRADQIRVAQPVPSGGFLSTPLTSDVLRAQRNPADMVSSALEARRQVLAESLAKGIDPDQPAIYLNPIPDKHGFSRHNQLHQELRDLNHEANQNAQNQAQQVHQTFLQDQHMKSAQDFTSMAHDLASIPFDVGTPQHEKAVLGVVASHPFGAQTTAGRELLTTHAKIHDGAANLSPEDRNYWQNFKQGFKDASEFARSVGVDVQYDGEGFPSIELTRDYAKGKGVFVKPGANAKDPLTEELYKGYKLVPSQILNPIEVKAGNVVNGVFKPDENGNVYQVDAGTGTRIKMPKAAFERFQQGFAPPKDETAAAAPVASATPTPDLDALAKKALADPNAPENVKTAARKRLGK